MKENAVFQSFHVGCFIECYRFPLLFLLEWYLWAAKLLQKSEMRKDIVIELSYKGFG